MNLPNNYTSAGSSKKREITKIIYYIFLSSILLFSYFNLSPSYSAYFNSDTAVQILQANDFHFTSDLYYWGQARQGSCTPLIGFIVHKITSIPTIHAISIVNYGILLALFLIFTSFLKNYLLKIAMAFVIFLPAIKFHFLVLFGHPYASQLLFIGIVYYSVNKLKMMEIKIPENFNPVNRLLFISLLASFLSIWLSEYSIVFLAYIYADLIISRYKEIPPLEIRKKWILILTISIATFLGTAFIFYAKYTATGAAYGGEPLFTKFDYLVETIKIHGVNVIKKQIFNSEHPFYSLVLLLLFIALFFLVKTIYKNSRNFLFLFLLSIFPAIVLNWVSINGWPSRFFTPAYFFLWMALLTSIDKNNFKTSYIAIGVVALVFLQSLSIIRFELTNSSELQKLKSFKQLGNCGLIGDYWASYNIAAANMDSIVATPIPYACRNFNVAEDVLNKKNIYLISNNWIENFPDSIGLFDVTLVKINNTAQEIEGYKLNKYRLKK